MTKVARRIPYDQESKSAGNLSAGSTQTSISIFDSDFEESGYVRFLLVLLIMIEETLKMIASGLIGAVAVWLVSEFVLPLISGFMSGAVKLHKNWNYRDSEEEGIVGTAKISQFGSRIKIEATRTIDREGGSINRKFIYKGKITGRTLVLRYQQKGARGTVAGAIVLRLDANLEIIKGVTSYFSDSDGSVVSHKIFYYASV